MKYYEEIPVIRAIATMLVLCIHLTAQLYNSNGVITDPILSYFNQIARLGTPIFAVISAFLLTSSTLNRKFSLLYFIKSRFTKIFIPYILWTTLYIVLRYLFTNTYYPPGTPLIKYYILGTAEIHLYFILVVIQFYLLFPFVHKLKKGLPLIAAYIVATIINVIWLNYGRGEITFQSDLLNAFVNSKAFILNWLSFFFLGICYTKFYKEINRTILEYKIYFKIIGMILFVDLIISIDITNLYGSSSIANIIYIPFFLALLIIFYNHVKNYKYLMKSLTVIGNYSMGIYLIHVLLIMIYRQYPYADIVNNPSTFVISYIVILCLSVISIYLISKLPFSSYIVPIPAKKTIINKRVRNEKT
ncbi:acyltransferase [Staphylococcus equorum]|uniref:acyltransferase n=1 Tax=Staphylococcus equorum TaxID=246432 RepID=UPI003FB884AE